MKKVILTFIVLGLIGLLAAPAWAAGPEETGRERVEAVIAQMEAQGDQRFADFVPLDGYLYYIDLMSNAGGGTGSGWMSFLVIGNWSFSVRIQLGTSFIPTGGTPADIVNRTFFIDPNDIVYLDQYDLGFNTFGSTNWFGITFTATNDFYTAGVLLYHSDFGLTFIRGDGPWQL